MKKGVVLFLMFIGIAIIALSWLDTKAGYKIFSRSAHSNPFTAERLHGPFVEKLQGKAALAEDFCKEHGFENKFCFLIDMSLPSGQNRFFIFDFKGDSILESGLVTHGCCNQYWLQGRKFDNRIGSGCTSLGKYRIGNSYFGRFGLAFKLYGLDKTNSNAFSRYVVLHSHECVPESETSDDICQSNGCPTVSPIFLKHLSSRIKTSKKPVLLWIYN